MIHKVYQFLEKIVRKTTQLKIRNGIRLTGLVPASTNEIIKMCTVSNEIELCVTQTFRTVLIELNISNLQLNSDFWNTIPVRIVSENFRNFSTYRTVPFENIDY